MEGEERKGKASFSRGTGGEMKETRGRRYTNLELKLEQKS